MLLVCVVGVVLEVVVVGVLEVKVFIVDLERGVVDDLVKASAIADAVIRQSEFTCSTTIEPTKPVKIVN